MKEKMILGITKNNTIVIANVENDRYFSVSYDEVEPMIITDEMIDDRLDTMVDDYICMFNNNADLTRKKINDDYNNYGIESVYDISLYSESFLVDDNEMYFISVGCGQLDLIDEIKYHENKELTEKIFRLWSKYHLEKVDNMEITDLFYDIEKENQRKDFDDLMESLGRKILKI